jgi:RNHCP domain-containing protein
MAAARPPRNDPEERDHGRRNPLPGGNEGFQCRSCGAEVRPLANGSVRNHCPECLCSLHVDRVPGDRAEACAGLQRAVGLSGGPSTGWTILFRCERCGCERRNRAADDDPVQPDRWDLLVELSTRALAKTAKSRSVRRRRKG